MPKFRVLIIERKEMWIKNLTKALDSFFIVRSAQYTDEVGAIIENFKPDVILLDLNLNDRGQPPALQRENLAGLEILQNLKANPLYKNLPVIIQTGSFPSEDIIKRAFAVGAFNFFEKNETTQRRRHHFIKEVYNGLENCILINKNNMLRNRLILDLWAKINSSSVSLAERQNDWTFFIKIVMGSVSGLETREVTNLFDNFFKMEIFNCYNIFDNQNRPNEISVIFDNSLVPLEFALKDLTLIENSLNEVNANLNVIFTPRIANIEVKRAINEKYGRRAIKKTEIIDRTRLDAMVGMENIDEIMEAML